MIHSGNTSVAGGAVMGAWWPEALALGTVAPGDDPALPRLELGLGLLLDLQILCLRHLIHFAF